MDVIKIKELAPCNKCKGDAELTNFALQQNKTICGEYICKCGHSFNVVYGWVDIITKKEMKRKSIKQILDCLYKMKSNKPIRTNIPGCSCIERQYGCDRGNYYNLYIGLKENEDSALDVASLIELLEDALEIGRMQGYNSGNYPITNETLVTLATYGHLGKYITDIKEEDDHILLVAELNFFS